MIALPLVVPERGPLATGGQIWAITRAELAMQWRRWGLWLVFAFATSLILVIFLANANTLRHPSPQSIYVRLHFTNLDYANFLAFATTDYGDLILGIVSALLVADRIGRDRQLGMFELQRATPLGYTRYILGKFVGNYLAILAPTFLSYLFCVIVLMALGAPSLFLQRFLLAFSLVFVPVYTAPEWYQLCETTDAPFPCAGLADASPDNEYVRIVRLAGDAERRSRHGACSDPSHGCAFFSR